MRVRTIAATLAISCILALFAGTSAAQAATAPDETPTDRSHSRSDNLPPHQTQERSEKVLYSFCSQFDCDDGSVPSGVIRDHDGNLYGANYAGGSGRDLGDIFRLGADGTYTELYAFGLKRRNGNSPASNLVRDKAGNLYGMTPYGGKGYDICYNYGCGTIYKLAPDGTETVLHRFNFTDGAFDGSGDGETPLLGADGNLYGATFHGGDNQDCYEGCGVIYRLAPNGKLKVLHQFNGSDGYFPAGPLIADQNGNFYGVTAAGGNSANCGIACGTVFELAADGTFTVLHSFQEFDGAGPFGPLVRDADGNLYGITVGGGDNSCDADGDGCGVVFRLAADGTLTVLHEFTGGSDGGFPADGLIADSSGNLYGMTVAGGIPHCEDGGIGGCGVVFKFTPDGTETVLYSFDNNDGGYYPGDGPLLIDAHGNLYGTTWEGGANGAGTLFEIKN